MASIPNFEELDDVLFGVSTRHQWNQLINQIEATNKANKSGSRNRKRNNTKIVLQERNSDMLSVGQEQKSGAKVSTAITQLYMRPLGKLGALLDLNFA